MESVVEDVEDQRQTEGSPANSQRSQESGGCDVMGISISVPRRQVTRLTKIIIIFLEDDQG